MKKISISVMMVIIFSLIAGAVFAAPPPPNPNQINALYIYSQKTLVNTVTKKKYLGPEKPCAGQDFYLIYVENKAATPLNVVSIIKRKTDANSLIFSKDITNVGIAELLGVANKKPESKQDISKPGNMYQDWSYWPVKNDQKYLLGSANIAGSQNKVRNYYDPLKYKDQNNGGSLDLEPGSGF